MEMAPVNFWDASFQSSSPEKWRTRNYAVEWDKEKDGSRQVHNHFSHASIPLLWVTDP